MTIRITRSSSERKTRSTSAKTKYPYFVQLPNYKKKNKKPTPLASVEEVASVEDVASVEEVASVSQIDFDDARDEWLANKKRLANGNYVYLCGKLTNSGKKCRRGCHDMIGLYSGCKIHYMWEEIEHHN